jgi:hypothetical protein
MTARHATALLAVLAAACGSSDPVGYSQPVDISLEARSAEVVGGQVHADKNVNTDPSNPYKAFVNAAVQALGHSPSRIVVTSATLKLDAAGSTLVTALEQVVAGTVRVSFEPNGSSSSYPVASVVGPTGVGPVTMAVSFDSSAMTPADFQDLVGGSFTVVLEGPAANEFDTRGATADMTATLTFVAYP